MLVLVSHPVLPSPSQSPYGEAQFDTPHSPERQVAVPFGWSGQTFEHVPQLLTLPMRLTSHPLTGSSSQSWKPLLQVMLQMPPWQLGVPFVPLHADPHALQFFASFSGLDSQPSAGSWLQSKNPSVQLATVHVPLVHAAVALARLQRLPQPPQLFTSVDFAVSHPFAGLPSQSAKPVPQEGEHLPPEQLTPP